MENITVNELLIKGDDDLINLFQFVAPKNHLKGYTGTKFWELPFHKVSELKRNTNNVVRQFEIVFGIEEKELLKIRVIDFFPALNWIKSEYDVLNQLENQITPIENEKLEKAGIKELDKLKEMNVIIPIAERFSMHPDDIASWRYGLIFTILLKENIESHVNHRLSQIK